MRRQDREYSNGAIHRITDVGAIGSLYTMEEDFMTPAANNQPPAIGTPAPLQGRSVSIAGLCVSACVLALIGAYFFDADAFMNAWLPQRTPAHAALQPPVPGGMANVKPEDIIALAVGTAVDLPDIDLRLTLNALDDARCEDPEADGCSEDGQLSVKGEAERISSGERMPFSLVTGVETSMSVFGHAIELVGVSTPLETVYVRRQ